MSGNAVVDVLVIGGGNAALCAALMAREAGASVLLLESAPRDWRGGNSAHTRNLRCMHDAPQDVLVDAYPEEEFWQDLLKVTGVLTNEHLARLVIRESSTCRPWMRRHGVHFQPALAGTLHVARTNAFFMGGGKALVNAYYRSAEQLSKKKPGSVDFASTGAGSASHLAGELFNQRAGIDVTHVPYKGGAPALQDLLGERVTSYFAAPPTALPHIEAGKLIPLATTGLTRPSYMPNIPTVAEAGYPGFKSLNWYAFVAPGKTPAPLLDRWNQEIVKVLNDPGVKEALNKHGLTPQPTTRAELTAFMKKESTQWATIIKERKLTAD